MNKKFDCLSIALYTLLLSIYAYNSKAIGILTVLYDGKIIHYFSFSFIFILLLIFQHGYYSRYLRGYGTYELIRNKKYITIYTKFIIRIFILAFISSIIRLMIEYITFSTLSITQCLQTFFFIHTIFFIQMGFELLLNDNIGTLITSMYLIISFSITDIFHEMHIDSLSYLFIINALSPDRILNPIFRIGICIGLSSILLIINYQLLKRKDCF